MAHDKDDVPEAVEALSREPLWVLDATTADDLVDEMADRLAALLTAHNLDANAEGWFQLALELALKHEPAFQIKTVADRTDRGGRPVGWGGFVLRSRMKQKMRDGLNQAAAAKAIQKETRGGISAKTAENAMSRKGPPPDEMRRWKYEWTAADALQKAARKLSQE